MRWSWHDSQRVGQIYLIIFYTFLFVLLNISAYSKKNRHIFFCFVFLGAVSCLMSEEKIFAFTEMAIFFGSYIMGIVLFHLMKLGAEKNLEKYFFLFLFLSAASLAIYFFMGYISSFFSKTNFDVWDFFNGFSNIRFFGQFMTLLIPVLVAPVLLRKKWSSAFFCISCIIFFMLIASGARAALMSLGSVVFIYLFIGKLSRGWAFLIIKISCIGFIMHYILIDILPKYFQIGVWNNVADRKLTGLSSRELIWNQAIEMLIQKPFFGFGPMHFANMNNTIANHPHQFFLQILSEWGIPFFLFLFFILIKIIIVVFKELKYFKKIKNNEKKVIYVCLVASIFSSLIQSMVDGVFVMPYTEIVFVFLAAWLASIYFDEDFKDENNKFIFQNIIIKLIVMFFSLILCFSFFESSPTYIGKSQDNYYNNSGDYMPRFWLNGGF